MNICKIKFFITIVFTVILSGCVSTIPLSEQLPSPSYMPENKILLSVIDNREKIKSGKPENFVGVVHGAFGVPFDWHVNQALSNETEDKDKNLSEFIEHRLINGLKNKGWNVDSVKINSQVKDSEIEEVLANNDAQKLLILNLNEWYFSINLGWVSSFNFDTDTLIQVYEIRNGKVLEKSIAGRNVIEEKSDESPQNNILRAYKAQLLEILNDPEIKNAILYVDQ